MKKTNWPKNMEALEEMTRKYGFPLETAFSCVATEKGGAAYFHVSYNGFFGTVTFKMEKAADSDPNANPDTDND